MNLPARRSATGGQIAGVCSAVADRWDVDPIIIRTLMLVLSLSGGLGVVLYAGAWFWWPKDPRPAAVDRWFHGLRQAPTAVLVFITCVVVTPILIVGSLLMPFGVAPAIIIVVTWWACARHARKKARRERARAHMAVPPHDGFREPDGLASDFAPVPGSTPHRPMPASRPRSSTRPPASTTGRGSVALVIITALCGGFTALGVKWIFGSIHILDLTIGIPVALAAAGAAGLLVHRPHNQADTLVPEPEPTQPSQE